MMLSEVEVVLDVFLRVVERRHGHDALELGHVEIRNAEQFAEFEHVRRFQVFVSLRGALLRKPKIRQENLRLLRKKFYLGARVTKTSLVI